jgi:hypothetical protein
MPFDTDGKFRFFRDRGMPDAIVLESERLRECLIETQRRPYHGAILTKPNGYANDDVECLRQVPHLKCVWIWDSYIHDLSGLYALPGLNYLRLTDRHGPVDFARLSNIETLVLEHSRRDRNLGSLKACKALYLWRFQPKERSWKGIEFPPNLESLEINWANPPDLAFWPILPQLRTLEFARCRNLSDLTELPRICPNLRKLVVYACGRAKDAPTEQLPYLEFAVVGNERRKG